MRHWATGKGEKDPETNRDGQVGSRQIMEGQVCHREEVSLYLMANE